MSQICFQFVVGVLKCLFIILKVSQHDDAENEYRETDDPSD